MRALLQIFLVSYPQLDFEDVLSSFSGKIDAIIDGGPCPIGVESTIIKIENQNLSILRPGKITEEIF